MPLANVEVSILGGSQVTTTDADGFYRLEDTPSGTAIVAFRGDTVTNAQEGFFIPAFDKRTDLRPGVENMMQGGPMEFFLPQLPTAALQTISNATGGTIVGNDISAPTLPPELRSLVQIEVAPGSLLDELGNPVDEAQIGLVTIAPELIQGGLPQGVGQIGLDMTLTVQALGVSRFLEPAKVTLPHLSDALPGEELDFISFDHDQGRLVTEGTFTVSADGQTVTTNEGDGITHPGWQPVSRPASRLRGNVENTVARIASEVDDDPNVQRVDPVPFVRFDETDAFLSKANRSLRFGVVNRGNLEVRRQQQADRDGNRFVGDPLEVSIQLTAPSVELEEPGVTGRNIRIEAQAVKDVFNQIPPALLVLQPGEAKFFDLEIKDITERFRRQLDNVLADFALQSFRLSLNFFNGRTGDRIGAPEGFNISRFFDVLEKDDFAYSGSQRRLTNGVQGESTTVRLLQFSLPGQSSTSSLSLRNVASGALTQIQDKLVFQSDLQTVPDSESEGLGAPEQYQLVANIDGTNHSIYDFEQVVRRPFAIRSGDNSSDDSRLFFGNILERSLDVLRSVHPMRDALFDRVASLRNAIGQTAKSRIESTVVPLFGESTQVEFSTPHRDEFRNFFIDFISDDIANSFIPDATLGTVLFDGVGTELPEVRDLLDELPNTQIGRSLQVSRVVGGAERFVERMTLNLASHVSQLFNGREIANLIGPEMSDEEIIDRLGNAIANTSIDGLIRLFGIPQAAQLFLNDDGELEEILINSTGNLINEPLISGRLASFNPTTALTLDPERLPESYRFLQFAARDRFSLLDSSGSPNAENVDRLNDLIAYLDRAISNNQRFGTIDSFHVFNTVVDVIDSPVEVREPVSLELPNRGRVPDRRVEIEQASNGTGETVVEFINNTEQVRTVNDVRIGSGGGSPFIGQTQMVGFNFSPRQKFPSTFMIAPDAVNDPPSGIVEEPVVIEFDDGSTLEFTLRTEFSERDLVATFNPSPLPDDSLLVEIFNRTNEPIPVIGIDITNGQAATDSASTAPISVPPSGQSTFFDQLDIFTVSTPDPISIPTGGQSTFFDQLGIFTVTTPDPISEQDPLIVPAGGTVQLPVTSSFVSNTPGIERATVRFLTSSNGNTSAIAETIFASNPMGMANGANSFVSITVNPLPGQMDNFEIRTVTDERGSIDATLPPNRSFQVSVFDPLSGFIAETSGVTGDSGQVTPLGGFVFRPVAGDDADNDGLPAEAERVIGTSPVNPDSNGDGIDDFEALKLGLDPLAGVGFPTGIIAAVDLQGEALEVVSVGSIEQSEVQTSFVATGDFGLAIIDTTQFDAPVILSEIDLSGNNADVAVDLARDLAVLAGENGGLHFVDIGNPLAPTLIESVILDGPANRVELFDGIAYVASATDLVAVDLATRQVIETVDFTSRELTDITREGNLLYAIDTQGRLQVLSIDGTLLRQRGNTNLSVEGGKLFVGNGLLLATSRALRGGYATVDVSNPDDPALVGEVGDSLDLPEVDTVANGSGTNVQVGSLLGTGPTTVVLDGTDPQITDAFLTSFEMPVRPHDLFISGGIGLVANGPAGLQLINYLPFDAAGQAPTASISTELDVDPATDGIQAIEGTRIPIQVVADDDVQIRNVELFVDGEIVENDVSFPFEFAPIGLGDDPVEIMVRVTDTGFNQTISDPLIVELIPDTIPPSLLSVSPSDGALEVVGPQLVQLRFDEPIDPVSFTEEDLTLTDAAGNEVAIASIDIRADDTVIQVLTEPLEVGEYSIAVQLDGLTDRAGNAGQRQHQSTFQVIDFQADVSWIGGSGDWFDGSNWDTGAVPTINDAVQISVPGDITVNIGDEALARQLLVTETIEIAPEGGGLTGLRVQGDAILAGRIVLSDGGAGNTTVFPNLSLRGTTTNFGTIDFFAGSFTGVNNQWINRGTITLSGGSSQKRASFLELINEGTIVQQGLANFDLGGLTTLLDNRGVYELQGGRLGSFSSIPTLRNNGQLIKSGTGTAQITLSLENHDELDVQAGTLQLTNSRNPHTDGLFKVAAGATLDFPSGDHRFAGNNVIEGEGSATTGAATDFILNTGATLTNNLDSFQVGADIEGNGQLVNNGSMTLTDLSFLGIDSVLQNNGTLNLTNVNLINATLENNGQAIYQGGGNLSTSVRGRVVNQPSGVFELQDGGLNGTGQFINEGTLRNSGPNVSTVSITVVDGGGTIDVAFGTLQLTRNLNLNNSGSLSGRGVMDANVTNTNGVILSGTSVTTPGRLTIDGNYTQLAGGSLSIEIGGAGLEDFSQLTVNGTANLAGTLFVQLINDFEPEVPDRFPVIQYESRQGEFDQLESSTPIDQVLTDFLDEILELEIRLE
ncbi:MAG: Ig-like domain-containing protein [Planctomycetota bacterium]